MEVHKGHLCQARITIEISALELVEITIRDTHPQSKIIKFTKAHCTTLNNSKYKIKRTYQWRSTCKTCSFTRNQQLYMTRNSIF
jgi:exopolysaccharide biosynthesis predicted pyruvyltransferase EpsI